MSKLRIIAVLFFAVVIWLLALGWIVYFLFVGEKHDRKAGEETNSETT